MQLKGLITRLGQSSTSSPPLGSLLLPSGGCRHGGDPIPERTGGLAHVPKTRLPEISHQVLLPHTPQISLPSPERALPLPLWFWPSPGLLSHLTYCCAIYQEPRSMSSGLLPRASWSWPSLLPFISPCVSTPGTVNPGTLPPLSGLVFALSLAPYRTSLKPICSPQPLDSTACLQDPGLAFPASSTQAGIAHLAQKSSLAWPSVSPAHSTRQVLINHCGGNNGQQKEAPEAFPYLTAALAACLPP